LDNNYTDQVVTVSYVPWKEQNELYTNIWRI
jgi:hypothetical protein